MAVIGFSKDPVTLMRFRTSLLCNLPLRSQHDLAGRLTCSWNLTYKRVTKEHQDSTSDQPIYIYRAATVELTPYILPLHVVVVVVVTE